MESLNLGVLLGLWLSNSRCLALWDDLARGIRRNCLGRLGNGVASLDVANGGETTSEESGPYGYDAIVSSASIRAMMSCRGVVPVRLAAKREKARVQAMVEVCGVESVGCLGG
jgi:hypothetical protein